MKTIVLAYHNIGCRGIESLLRNGFQITAVFTHKDDPKENIWFDSVGELAASKNIPVFAPDDINHPLWIQRIKKMNPDIIFSFYYRKMVKPAILDIPSSGCLNLHGSLLPKYRGRCPVNWVLVNGEKETGVTLHEMTPQPDDGDIVGQKKVAISEGEIDWSMSSKEIRNLVRAVTQPYPGAFSYIGDRQCLFWSVTEVPTEAPNTTPGTVVSTNPLMIACGQGAIRVDSGQSPDGVFITGTQLAGELNLSEGMKFGPHAGTRIWATRKKNVLILGVNGFIGNALSQRLLESGRYEVHGMDLQSNYIQHLIGKPNFHFEEGDISIHGEWIEYHIKKCDIVLPLVAIATPIEYVRNPLKVFELDFEENLRLVRYCVKCGNRVIFPSTSE